MQIIFQLLQAFRIHRKAIYQLLLPGPNGQSALTNQASYNDRVALWHSLIDFDRRFRGMQASLRGVKPLAGNNPTAISLVASDKLFEICSALLPLRSQLANQWCFQALLETSLQGAPDVYDLPLFVHIARRFSLSAVQAEIALLRASSSCGIGLDWSDTGITPTLSRGRAKSKLETIPYAPTEVLEGESLTLVSYLDAIAAHRTQTRQKIRTLTPDLWPSDTQANSADREFAQSALRCALQGTSIEARAAIRRHWASLQPL